MKNNRGNSAAVIALLLMGMTGCSRPSWTPIGPAVEAGIKSDGVISLAPARAHRLVVADVRPAESIGAEQEVYEGWIDVGGRALYLACLGVGEPVVVFEMDQGESGAEALAYAGSVSARTRVCYYDRPNVYGGYSDSVSGARTSQDIVNDLAALLRGAGLVSPYILAGKSFGAMNAALFAAQRAKDVAGLVLLDPLSPGPAEAGAETVEIEAVDIEASAAQLKAAPRLVSVPTVLLTTERLAGDPSFYSQLAPRLQRVAVNDNGLVASPSARARVSRAIIQMIEEYRKRPSHAEHGRVASGNTALDESRDRRYPQGMTEANNLPAIADRIRETLKLKNAARDAAVNISRELIRFCSLAIRAAHRDDWDAAERLVGEARRAADELGGHVRPYPDLYFTGYTQDAFKELAEAHITIAIARGQPFPQPEDIGVEFAAYLNGLAESAGELRRRTLDKLRAGHSAECERLLGAMDDIYDVLVGMDFPDALTGGLRRNTDMVRGVLERTRGELTTSFREAELKSAMDALAGRLG